MGSVGQRASKLLAVKFGGLKKKFASRPQILETGLKFKAKLKSRESKFYLTTLLFLFRNTAAKTDHSNFAYFSKYAVRYVPL